MTNDNKIKSPEVKPKIMNAVKPPDIKNPFAALCEKHKVGKLEASGLRYALALDMNDMITENEFTKGRVRWLAAPSGK